jgi:hypothetical protein
VWRNPEDASTAVWDHQLEGEAVAGTFEDVLKKLVEIQVQPKVMIGVFTRSSGLAGFIEQCRGILGSIPMIGGCAAAAAGQTAGEILPAAGEAAVLLLYDEKLSVVTENIHQATRIQVQIDQVNDRCIGRMRATGTDHWIGAAEFYREHQKIRGILRNDFESLTFSDLEGRNIHCSITNSNLMCGADVPDERLLVIRQTTREQAYQKIASFISNSDTLIFGCAGLRSFLDQPVLAGENSLAGFMFGELVTLNDKGVFGNLMLSRLIYS